MSLLSRVVTLVLASSSDFCSLSFRGERLLKKKKNAVEIVSVVFFFFKKNYRYEFLRNKSAEAKQTEPSMFKKKKKKTAGASFVGTSPPGLLLAGWHGVATSVASPHLRAQHRAAATAADSPPQDLWGPRGGEKTD